MHSDLADNLGEICLVGFGELNAYDTVSQAPPARRCSRSAVYSRLPSQVPVLSMAGTLVEEWSQFGVAIHWGSDLESALVHGQTVES